jgi:hypothetical protein
MKRNGSRLLPPRPRRMPCNMLFTLTQKTAISLSQPAPRDQRHFPPSQYSGHDRPSCCERHRRPRGSAKFETARWRDRNARAYLAARRTRCTKQPLSQKQCRRAVIEALPASAAAWRDITEHNKETPLRMNSRAGSVSPLRNEKQRPYRPHPGLRDREDIAMFRREDGTCGWCLRLD